MVDWIFRLAGFVVGLIAFLLRVIAVALFGEAKTFKSSQAGYQARHSADANRHE